MAFHFELIDVQILLILSWLISVALVSYWNRTRVEVGGGGGI